MKLDAANRRLSLDTRDPAFYQDPYPTGDCTTARLELQTALPILWARLPDLELDGEPSFKNSYHFRGLESLRVRY